VIAEYDLDQIAATFSVAFGAAHLSFVVGLGVGVADELVVGDRTAIGTDGH
jgi:hypothetical protein